MYLSRIRIFRRIELSSDCFDMDGIRSILSFSSRLDKDANEDSTHYPKSSIKTSNNNFFLRFNMK
jgi:hypothetical protein